MVAPPFGLLAPAHGGSKDSLPLDRLSNYSLIFEFVKGFLRKSGGEEVGVI
jgi:hypothetical protein